jgi:alpha-beta hydrolase superfamily lysophospholipase
MPAAPSNRNSAAESTITVTFSSDGLRLQGTLHLPGRRRPNVIVGSHGLYSSGESPKQAELARRCSRMGIAYLRFDHRGCGRSEGRFEDVTTLAGRCRDIVDAVAFLRRDFSLGAELGLFGSSLGGATCLAAAPIVKPCRMVTLAAPVDSRSILAATEEAPPVEPFFAQESFQFDLRSDLPLIKGLLAIHGTCDAVIPPEHARIIFDGAADPKQHLIISGGDHRLSQPDHRRQFIEAALQWFAPLGPSPSVGSKIAC